MNILLFSENHYIDTERISINDPAAVNHILLIMKKEKGDLIQIGKINGQCGTGKIIEISTSRVIIDVKLSSEPPDHLPLTLICALPRPKVFKRVLFISTCMGVKRIHFIKTWRVDKSYWKSPLLDESSVIQTSIDALAQCGDTVLPEVKFHNLFKPFAEDILPSLSAGTLKLTAHPYSERHLPFNIQKASTLIIGPEGGLIPFEISLLESIGFSSVSAGRRILTVETAVSSLISKLYP